MYKEIEIENFRGIRSLQLKDMRRINLIAGRNNSGKTSVLEALLLLTGISNPKLALDIHQLRNLALQQNEDFGFMFHNQNFASDILLKAIDGSDAVRELCISPKYESNVILATDEQAKKPVSQNLANGALTTSIPKIESMEMRFKVGDAKERITGISLKGGKIELRMLQGHPNPINGAFFTPQNCVQPVDEFLEKLLVKKKLSSVIPVLQEIAPTIQDIRMGAKGMVYVDFGLDTLLPLNIMGDGIRKILTFLAAIVGMGNGIILIDEIENGLHYSTLKTLWKALISASREQGVQIVATTHSYECLSALAEVNEESPDSEDIVRLYRMEKRDGQTTTFLYDRELLKLGIEKNIEMR